MPNPPPLLAKKQPDVPRPCSSLGKDTEFERPGIRHASSYLCAHVSNVCPFSCFIRRLRVLELVQQVCADAPVVSWILIADRDDIPLAHNQDFDEGEGLDAIVLLCWIHCSVRYCTEISNTLRVYGYKP